LQNAPKEFWQQLKQARSGEQVGKLLDDFLLNGKFDYRQKYKGRDIGYGTMEFKYGLLTDRTWSGCSRPLEVNRNYPAKFFVKDDKIIGSSKVCCNCDSLGPWTLYEYSLFVYEAEKLHNKKEKQEISETGIRIPVIGTGTGLYNDGSKKVYEIGGYLSGPGLEDLYLSFGAATKPSKPTEIFATYGDKEEDPKVPDQKQKK